MSQLEPIDVLAIGAHPDDAELGAGGALAWATRAGLRTAILDLTRGERATQGTPEERAREAAAAAELLGLTWRANLELPDAGVVDELASAARIAALLRRVRPRCVLTHAEGEAHPDHRGCAQLVARARHIAGLARSAPAGEQAHTIERAFAFALEPQASHSLVLALDEELWQRKRAALSAHTSQLDPSGQAPHLQARGDLLARADRASLAAGALVGAPRGECLLHPQPLRIESLPL